MRELWYVPIIHSEADLGSLGPILEQRSASLYGEKRWAEHKKIVARFWKRLADFLLSRDATRLKIYQDGLAAEGALGRRIIEEAADRGSLNHQMLWQLMSRGAEVRKTEDPSLLLEELWLTRQASAASGLDRAKLSLQRARLTEKRDRFIARTIDETLRQGEQGLLFIGAYHNVSLYLPEDISVEPLKERAKVMAYFEELVSAKETQRWRELARYLTSPVVARRRV